MVQAGVSQLLRTVFGYANIVISADGPKKSAEISLNE
jgi:hypothetical protein